MPRISLHPKIILNLETSGSHRKCFGCFQGEDSQSSHTARVVVNMRSEMIFCSAGKHPKTEVG